jgi:hypothetical protein
MPTWVWIFPVITICGGPVFYVLRQRQRWAYVVYGVCEFIAGVGLSFFTVFPPTTTLDVGPDPSTIKVIFWGGVVALAGIFMMVQGLDDLRQGLPVRHREKWDSFFRAVGRSKIING